MPAQQTGKDRQRKAVFLCGLGVLARKILRNMDYQKVPVQLLFDYGDRVWHLHSESWRPGNQRVMHAQPGDPVSLLPVPVLRWSSVSPVMTELAVREDPWEAIQARGWRQKPVKYDFPVCRQ